MVLHHDHDGQVNKMAGGDTSTRHGGGDLCGHPHRRLGDQVRRPGGDYVRQGDAVHLPGLVPPLQEAGHHPHNNISLSSAEQRPGRESSPPAQGRPEIEAGQPRMAGTPPLGTARHAELAQGRQRHLSAELVYGAPLVLPGEFVDAAEPPAADFL